MIIYKRFIKYIDIYKRFDIIDIYHDKTIFESEGLLWFMDMLGFQAKKQNLERQIKELKGAGVEERNILWISRVEKTLTESHIIY